MRNKILLLCPVLLAVACTSPPAMVPADAGATMTMMMDPVGKPDARVDDPDPPQVDARVAADTASPGRDTNAPDTKIDDGPFTGRVKAGTRLKPVYARTAEGERFFL